MKLINIDSYNNLAEIEYDINLIPKSCLILVDAKNIGRFFHQCKYSKNKYIVLTISGDNSICYQKDYPPSSNMANFMAVFRDDMIKEIVTKEAGELVQIHGRYYQDKCKATDKYITRISTFGMNTFSEEIPDNVLAWFGTNLNLDHPKIIHLPFGVNSSANIKYDTEDKSTEFESKANMACLTYSNHTYERIRLIEKFSDADWMNVIKKEKDKPGIPYEQYIEVLDKHKFVICPAGCGFDCFRTYETLYIRSIPVLKDEHWCRWMKEDGWPVILVNNLLDITIEQLLEESEKIKNIEFDRTKLSEDYWKNKILDSIKLL